MPACPYGVHSNSARRLAYQRVTQILEVTKNALVPVHLQVVCSMPIHPSQPCYYPPELFREVPRASCGVRALRDRSESFRHLLLRTRLSRQPTVLESPTPCSRTAALSLVHQLLRCFSSPLCTLPYPWPYRSEVVALHSRESVHDAIPMMIEQVCTKLLSGCSAIC